MARHASIRRYSLILEKIGRKQFPSFKLIQDYLLKNDIDVSNRTIQRDIEQIRFEFGVDIQYDRVRDGYFIDTESSFDINSFLRFLEIVNTADLLTESLKESKDVLNYISFESHGEQKGVEHLKSLLFATKNHRKVEFTHRNFATDKQKKYTAKPYLLKEYQNRWYVIAMIGKTEDFRTFGLDRIEELEVKEELFQAKADFNPMELFHNTVGLTYSNHEVEEVILSFTAFQGKYVKTLPLHQSQEIILDNEEELRVKLYVKPNYEFMQKILMLGDQVKVLMPSWFSDDIKKCLKSSLSRYS